MVGYALIAPQFPAVVSAIHKSSAFCSPRGSCGAVLPRDARDLTDGTRGARTVNVRCLLRERFPCAEEGYDWQRIGAHTLRILVFPAR
jgi:hypothetical protein